MGEIVRRGLLLSFSVLLGCSGSKARSDAESQPAPPVVSGTAVADDTTSAGPVIEAAGEGKQPAVVFQCEGGRLSAYLVTTASGDEGRFGEQMVPIRLDSAPGC
jgi:hypothetical protein